jgi:exodeoxyribonuclease V alpha subunit
MTISISKERFAAIIEAARIKKLSTLSADIATKKAQEENVGVGDGFIQTLSDLKKQSLYESTDKYGKAITYNEKQSQFISLASTHQDCCLIGPAGTGKTTCMKGAVTALTQSPKTGILQNHDHKYLPHGVPGIVICAYTRRATNNIRRNMDESMKANCITIHKLLEYGPEFFEIIDDNGNEKKSMRFVPLRNAMNPLPSEITTIIFEESSMIALSLYQEVISAIQHHCQIIFLGDIQQLPPVFGPAILGFKLTSLPTIELTEVYRQALESPIIRLAHRILSGDTIPESKLPEWNVPNLSIKPWKKKIEAEAAVGVTNKLFIKLLEERKYDPENDIILIPFGKSYGTIEINKYIANHLAKSKELVVWEIIAGFVKHYLAVGDKVLYDREDAIVLDIYPNPAYTGISPQRESTYLDYWGHNHSPSNSPETSHESTGSADVDIDFILAQIGASDSEDRVTQSSHHIKLLMMDSDQQKTITKAAEVNALILGYALTIHKAQGSEWDKVFLLLHNSHATMISRELIYTAVTRAKKELFIICEGDTFERGVKIQRIKGDTLAEKSEFFKGKIDNKELQS